MYLHSPRILITLHCLGCLFHITIDTSQEIISLHLLIRGANFLILRNGFLAKRLLFISHILRLDFHTQTTTHRHINTILQGSSTEDGMIRNRRDMACHSDGWKEIAGSPVGSTTTTRSALDNYIFIFGTNTVGVQ